MRRGSERHASDLRTHRDQRRDSDSGTTRASADGGPSACCHGTRREARAERFAGVLGRAASRALVFFAALLARLRRARRRCRSCSRCFVDHVLRQRRRRPRRRRRERDRRSLVADRTPFLTDASAVGSTVGGAPVLPILVGLIAHRLRRPAPLAHRGVRGLRAGRRVGDLPRHLVRRPARAPGRAPAGGPAGDASYPSGPHRRVGRRLRRPGAACSPRASRNRSVRALRLDGRDR